MNKFKILNQIYYQTQLKIIGSGYVLMISALAKAQNLKNHILKIFNKFWAYQKHLYLINGTVLGFILTLMVVYLF